MLRGHQRHPGVDQLLLRIEHIERGALADAGLLANTVQRYFGGVDLRSRGFNLRLRGVKLTPTLHHRFTRLIAVDVKVEALLTKVLLGLPDRRVFSAALV